jgi:hypothetical protein
VPPAERSELTQVYAKQTFGRHVPYPREPSGVRLADASQGHLLRKPLEIFNGAVGARELITFGDALGASDDFTRAHGQDEPVVGGGLGLWQRAPQPRGIDTVVVERVAQRAVTAAVFGQRRQVDGEVTGPPSQSIASHSSNSVSPAPGQARVDVFPEM